jgi:hypothetical protein
MQLKPTDQEMQEVTHLGGAENSAAPERLRTR